jgi:hypothetical protein
MDSVPAPLKPFFEDGYRKALSAGQTWEHCYECSSPAVYRQFRMAVYPAPAGDGLVVVNSLAVERPHDGGELKASLPNEAVYADRHGITTMCCHCRRVRRPEQVEVWDWVPAYVEKPPHGVSHGLCMVCLSLYYPEPES